MGKTVEDGFIPKHGGYRELLSYRKALIVYQGTMCFCRRFIDRADKRTREQMIQAARSGKQNIIEGSVASGTSKEMEIKLVGVARASLEELLEDYEDYLRTHGHTIWDKNSKPALAVRRLTQPGKTPQGDHKSHTSHTSHESHVTYETYKPYIEQRSAETVANMIICLIHQANYLLDRQIRQLEKAFLEDGGMRERMTRARLDARKRPDPERRG